MFDYFYNKETEQFLFYSVPQMLFTSENFKKLSCEAKLLYGILLDRTRLSIKNNWTDNEERIYIYFKQDEACNMLNIGKDKCVKTFNELEKVGLIEKKRQGQGKPSRIYVKNFTKSNLKEDNGEPKVHNDNSRGDSDSTVSTEFSTNSTSSTVWKTDFKSSGIKTSDSRTSRTLKKRILEVFKTDTNNNNRIITSDKDQSYQPEKKLKEKSNKVFSNFSKKKSADMIDGLKQQFDYEELVHQKNKQGYNCYSEGEIMELIELMSWVNLTSNESIRVNSEDISMENFRERILQMDYFHLEYVLDCIKANTKPIKARRNYLLTCLYNAVTTMDGYYANKVCSDLRRVI